VDTPRQQLLEDARKIQEYLDPLPPKGAAPVLVMVGGLPSSGKSHFSRRLASRYPLAHLDSDALRRALFGQPSHSVAENRRLFDACHYVLDSLLRAGIPTIFDATNLREEHRRQVYRIADKRGAKLILVWLEAPPALIRQRLERRAHRADPEDVSDADPEVYERLRRDVDPIERPHLSVDTSTDIEPAIAAVLAEIQGLTSQRGASS
jgi:predicted kinase